MFGRGFERTEKGATSSSSSFVSTASRFLSSYRRKRQQQQDAENDASKKAGLGNSFTSTLSSVSTASLSESPNKQSSMIAIESNHVPLRYHTSTKTMTTTRTSGVNGLSTTALAKASACDHKLTERSSQIYNRNDIGMPSPKRTTRPYLEMQSSADDDDSNNNVKSSPTKKPYLEIQISSDDNESDSSLVEHLTPTIDFLQNHCWTCHTQVRAMPDQPCLYALHEHVLLHVPCCMLCTELEPSDSDCRACGDGGTLLLCDICDSAYCTTCVAQAHGGRQTGRRQVQTLLSQTDTSWACLECMPPPPLRTLQASLSQQPSSNETELQVLELLEAVENDLDQNELDLSDQHLQELRHEIQKELPEDAVDQELELWVEARLQHKDLLDDRKVDLLERLNGFGISEDQYYRWRQEQQAPQQQQIEEEPTWKAAADKEVDERRMKILEQDDTENLNDDDQDDDSSDDETKALAHVEDLCNDNEREEWETDTILRHRMSWRQNKSRAKMERDLNKHLKNDDALLERMGSRIVRVELKGDKQDLEHEFREASRQNVRRDALVQIRQGTRNQALNRTNKTTDIARSASSSFLVARKRTASKSIGGTSLSFAPKGQSPSETNRRQSKDPDIDMSIPEEGNKLVKSLMGDPFWDSCVELCAPDNTNRQVTIAGPVAANLKPHQVEGVKFMWNNVCRDLSSALTHEQASAQENVGGCILAHVMGLGKSFQVVALIHTLFHHPSLRPANEENPKAFISKVLLVVPVNTLTNWENEFSRWTGSLKYQVRIFEFSGVVSQQKAKLVRKWTKEGGVLLIGLQALTRILKSYPDLSTDFLDPGPDLVVLDEAHTMLKGQDRLISKAMSVVKTKRRIACTGTPFVNNMKEYYTLVDWVRKGTLGTRSHFASQYETPILAGLNADSSTQQIASQVQRSKELFRSIASFIQRRDVSILTRDLPPFQTAVITLRPSKLQSLLYRKFDKWFKSSGEKMSFISHYQMLRPLHNHPYCLLQQARMSFQKRSDELADSMEGSETIDSDTAVKKESPKIQTRGGKDEKGSSLIQLLDCDDKEPSSGRSSPIENQEEPGRISSLESKENETNPKLDSESKRGRKIIDYSWVEELSETMDDSEITSAKNGYKLYILLQILAHSQSLGDKVVVFSQCLKSLDFIEQVLMSKDWGRYCQGFEKCEDLGGWRKGVEYLRIDGGTKSSERGDLVAKFDEKLEANMLFLISIEAGGLGINLTAANRVVLFDNHWNPTITSQAFHRCYRYGQQKPVFGYRFLTQGSMEETIFSRSMNKSGIAARLVDQRYPERFFSAIELEEIKQFNDWVQCDRCEKWRMLFCTAQEDVPDTWYCEMNNDPYNNTCRTKECDDAWYQQHRSIILDKILNKSDSEHFDSRDSTSDLRLEDIELTRQRIEKDQVLVAIGALKLFEEKSKRDKLKASGSPTKNRKSGGLKPTDIFSRIRFQEMLQIESTDLKIEEDFREAEAVAKEKEEAAKVKQAKKMAAKVKQAKEFVAKVKQAKEFAAKVKQAKEVSAKVKQAEDLAAIETMIEGNESSDSESTERLLALHDTVSNGESHAHYLPFTSIKRKMPEGAGKFVNGAISGTSSITSFENQSTHKESTRKKKRRISPCRLASVAKMTQAGNSPSPRKLTASKSLPDVGISSLACNTNSIRTNPKKTASKSTPVKTRNPPGSQKIDIVDSESVSKIEVTQTVPIPDTVLGESTTTNTQEQQDQRETAHRALVDSVTNGLQSESSRVNGSVEENSRPESGPSSTSNPTSSNAGAPARYLNASESGTKSEARMPLKSQRSGDTQTGPIPDTVLGSCRSRPIELLNDSD